MKWILKLRETWKRVLGESIDSNYNNNNNESMITMSSIQEAISYVKQIAFHSNNDINKKRDVRVLVTGSLYLVGDVLKHIQ